MGIEKREGTQGTYFCRTERRGGKTVRTYVGKASDPVVAVIHRLDRSRQALRQLNLAAERDDDLAELDRLIRKYDRRARVVLCFMRREAAMKAQTLSQSPATLSIGARPRLPTKEEFLVIVNRAEAGNVSARVEVQRLLAEHEELWEPLGDIGRLVENRLLDLAARNSYLLRASMEQFITKTRQTLLAEGDGPLEKFLVHRIIGTYLEVAIRQTHAEEAVSGKAKSGRERLLDQAQWRQIESLKALQEMRLRRDSCEAHEAPERSS